MVGDNKYYFLQRKLDHLILPSMAEIERMSIALPAPMADAVRRAVDAGEYASASEVIRDALRLWESRRQLRERDLEVLRQRWDDGRASGRAGPLDIKRIIAEERARLDSDEDGRG